MNRPPPPSVPTPWASLLATTIALGLLAEGRSEPTDAAAADVAGVRRYLEAFALDRQARELLDAPGAWNDERTVLAVRTLVRLSLAPPGYADSWRRAALDETALASPPQDRLVRFSGRAVFVAPLVIPGDIALPAAAADQAPPTTIDIVRMRSSGGATIDILTPSAPRSWPRWRQIEEPAIVDGLPLASGTGPVPSSGEGDWPAGPPTLLVAARRVAWPARGVAGEAGMDAGLFDRVVDGRKLTADDADAFFALLAAAGRTASGAIAAAAGAPASIIPLIDPSEHWFRHHRGDPVAIEGTALRVTRIEIDDPLRRRETGIDHYWEVFVFVSTPPIEVGGKVQDRYPVVCCLRELPAGMPTGSTTNERVRVAAFALKSYAYPLADRDGTGRRREAPLLVGGDVTWLRPGPAPGAGVLGWVLASLAALLAVGLTAVAWKGSIDARKDGRRRRGALPESLRLPADEATAAPAQDPLPPGVAAEKTGTPWPPIPPAPPPSPPPPPPPA